MVARMAITPTTVLCPVISTTVLATRMNSGPYGARVFCHAGSTLADRWSLSTDTPYEYGSKPCRARSPCAR